MNVHRLRFIVSTLVTLVLIVAFIPIAKVDAAPTTSISSLSYPKTAVQGEFSVTYTISYSAQGYSHFVIRTGVTDDVIDPFPLSSIGGGLGSVESMPDNCGGFVQYWGEYGGICFLEPTGSTGLENVTVTINSPNAYNWIDLTPGRYTLTAFAMIASVSSSGGANYFQSSGSQASFSVTVAETSSTMTSSTSATPVPEFNGTLIVFSFSLAALYCILERRRIKRRK